MHAYCANNPINRDDPTGVFWNIVGGAVLGGLLSGGLEIVSQLITGTDISEIDWSSVAIEALTGAATGALVSMGLPSPKLLLGSTVVNAANSLAHSYNNGDDMVKASQNLAITTLSTLTLNTVAELKPSRTYTSSIYGHRKVNQNYQPKNQTRNNFNNVARKSATSAATDTVKRFVNNLVTIGKINYKVCPQCGCPHIIVR